MAGRVKATEYYYNWFFTQTASIRGGNSETLKQQEAKQQDQQETAEQCNAEQNGAESNQKQKPNRRTTGSQ
ncbi:MAG TPA: hypothetical protein DCP64_14535 [Sarcina sp.]|nr:hypothetical protein [Sarcina sp.]